MDTLTVKQNIFKREYPPISVTICGEPATLEHFLKEVPSGHIGLAPVYGRKQRLTKLAMATASYVLVINLLSNTAASSKKLKKSPVCDILGKFFSTPGVTLHGFKMDYIAAALYFDHGIQLAASKRLLSVSTEKQLEGLMEALGGKELLNKAKVVDLFQNEETSRNNSETTVLQAWAAYQAATMPHVLQLPVINTLAMDKMVLIFIYYMDRRFLCLFKP